MSTVYLSISLPLLPDSEVSHTWIKIQSHQPNFDPCMGTGWLYRSLLNFCTTTLTDFPYWISTASPDQCILMAEKSARIPRLSGSDSPVHTACVNGETESKGLILTALWAARDRLGTMQCHGEHCFFSLSLSNDSNLYSWESTCESLHLHCDSC